jgi:hypothetical protein
MSKLIRSMATRLRQIVGDRRHTPRRKAQRKARLLFSVSLLDTDTGKGERLLPLEGYTRDISETGLALVVPSVRIGDRYLTDKDCKLRIVLLDLPTGQVEIQATPVRYEQLTEGETEGKHLIGARITKMTKSDRARFVEYLKKLRSQVRDFAP